jgi:hypothetical protein
MYQSKYKYNNQFENNSVAHKTGSQTYQKEKRKREQRGNQHKEKNQEGKQEDGKGRLKVTKLPYGLEEVVKPAPLSSFTEQSVTIT